MVTHVTTAQRVRLPIVAIAAFGLGVLTTMSVPHLSVGATTADTALIVQKAPAVTASRAEPITASQAQSVTTSRAEAGQCAQGAYVTGDLVGDASPAAVLAQLCGGRP